MWGNKNTINKTSAGRPSRDDRQRAGQAKTAPARVAREPAKKLRKLDKAPKAARAVKATRKEKAARGRQAVPPPKAVRDRLLLADGLGRGDGLPAPGGLLFPGGLHGTRGLRRLVQLSQLLRGLPRHPRRRGLCLPGALTVVPGGPAGRRLVDGVLVTPHVPSHRGHCMDVDHVGLAALLVEEASRNNDYVTDFHKPCTGARRRDRLNHPRRVIDQLYH